MVAQRCLGAKTNSPRKFAFVSCSELPKQTQNKLNLGLILFEVNGGLDTATEARPMVRVSGGIIYLASQ